MWPSVYPTLWHEYMVAVMLVAKYVWTIFTTFPATHLSGKGATAMEEEETVPGQLDVPDTSKPDNSSASSSAQQMNTAGVSIASQGTDNIHAVDVS